LRLLPPGHSLGWTPYLWLAFLGFFLIEPGVRLHRGAMSAGYALATAAALLAFLVSYFFGFWARGRALLLVILVQCGVGVVMVRLNPGATVFLVYAASFAGTLASRPTARGLILMISMLGAVTSWLTVAPPWYWLPAVGMPLIIGLARAHEAQIERADAKLRLAHEQIEHLATIAERERIARDLHDLLGHTLSLIVLKSELARKLAPRDLDRAVREVHDIEQVARRALGEVREAIRGYRASFPEEVERSRSMLRAADIDTKLEAGQVRPQGATEEALALALREAVTNVVRHSGASSCRIRVATEAGEYLLEVEDDGAAAHAPEGSGLRGMRERVEALGGTVRRGPGARGRGFRLEVRVPLAMDMAAVEIHASRPTAVA
jgi:two-component system sensor histidine kinase DesK